MVFARFSATPPQPCHDRQGGEIYHPVAPPRVSPALTTLHHQIRKCCIAFFPAHKARDKQQQCKPVTDGLQAMRITLAMQKPNGKGVQIAANTLNAGVVSGNVRATQINLHGNCCCMMMPTSIADKATHTRPFRRTGAAIALSPAVHHVGQIECRQQPHKCTMCSSTIPQKVD